MTSVFIYLHFLRNALGCTEDYFPLYDRGQHNDVRKEDGMAADLPTYNLRGI